MTKACPSRSSRARGPGGQGASEQPVYPARPPAGQYPESFYFSWVTGPSKKFIKPVDSFLEKDNHTHTPLGGCMHAHMHTCTNTRVPTRYIHLYRLSQLIRERPRAGPGLSTGIPADRPLQRAWASGIHTATLICSL